MKAIAIIPARGGSKRIPKKNIKLFLGKPIISYSIEMALKSKLFDKVMVSTDDEEIAKIAIKYGAEVPFFRSKKNSDDNAGTEDVLFEVINKYKESSINFDIMCCIYPTSPLIRLENLIEGKNTLINNNFSSVVTLTKFSYPIQRAIKIENIKSCFAWPKFEKFRSQDLNTFYHDCGQFYWVNINDFIKKKKIFNNNSGFIELSEIDAQDIDSLTDWEMAELKYKLRIEKR